jgi:hypothetical protein
MATNTSRYHEPDPVLADAIYSHEDGGINPIRGWCRWRPTEISGKSGLRYNLLRRLRTSYQGHYDLSAAERSMFERGDLR